MQVLRLMLLTLTLTCTAVYAESPIAAPEKFMPLTSGEQAQLVDQMRASVRQSRYGQRGLERIFKNFEGDHYLDPTTPGVQRNVRYLSSPSWQQAKGAMRTLAYGQSIAADDRFKLIAMDRPVTASYGTTDKDLVFQHGPTGQMCRIEVKDVSPRSQRADLTRIKGQIYKMAAEYRRTGELQAWANRQEVLPEIRSYADSVGIPVFDDVKQNDFGLVNDYFDKRAVAEAKVRLVRGSARTQPSVCG